MPKDNISKKTEQLLKTNSRIVGYVGAASFIVVFCLVASLSLYSQSKYQAKVAGAKLEDNKQLDANISAFSTLQNSYKKFNNSTPNVIGGNPKGTADNDGNNAKIVLNSLPSVYDFPALTSSLEKILTDRGIPANNITGVDQQLSQKSQSTATPTPIKIPFSVSTTSNYGSTVNLLDSFEKSIRPIQIEKMTISGSSSAMTLSIQANTYFQSPKDLKIDKKVVQ